MYVCIKYRIGQHTYMIVFIYINIKNKYVYT